MNVEFLQSFLRLYRGLGKCKGKLKISEAGLIGFNDAIKNGVLSKMGNEYYAKLKPTFNF